MCQSQMEIDYSLPEMGDIQFAIVQRARRVLYVNIEQHLYASCIGSQ